MQWEIKIVGLSPQGKRKMKFVVVTIDYFTKWVEAKPLAKITERNTQDFVCRSIIYRFGIP